MGKKRKAVMVPDEGEHNYEDIPVDPEPVAVKAPEKKDTILRKAANYLAGRADKLDEKADAKAAKKAAGDKKGHKGLKIAGAILAGGALTGVGYLLGRPDIVSGGLSGSGSTDSGSDRDDGVTIVHQDDNTTVGLF